MRGEGLSLGHLVGLLLALCLLVAAGLAWADGGSGLRFAKWLARLSLGCWVLAGLLLAWGAARRAPTTSNPRPWPLMLFLVSLPLFALSALFEMLAAGP